MLCTLLVAGEANSSYLAEVKNWAEFLAYVFAFIFFVYKTYDGYLTTSLSLTIRCQRTRSYIQEESAEIDYLAVVTTIKKGANGLIRLLVAEVRVMPLVSGAEQRQPLDITRINYDRSRILRGEPYSIDWNKAKKGWNFLQFPGGDESQFACVFKVPHREPCKVDVVIMGRGRWPRIKTGQWRASEISLPNENKSQPQR
jgi:hypothetical protein